LGATKLDSGAGCKYRPIAGVGRGATGAGGERAVFVTLPTGPAYSFAILSSIFALKHTFVLSLIYFYRRFDISFVGVFLSRFTLGGGGGGQTW